MEKIKKVLSNCEQGLSTAEKAQARENIGASGEYAAGSNITISNGIISVTGLAAVANTGSYDDLSDQPNIPAAQVQADWSQSNSSAVDFIKNKPTIPAAQVQADWNVTNTASKAYIINKPNVTEVRRHLANASNPSPCSQLTFYDATRAVSTRTGLEANVQGYLVPESTTYDNGKVLTTVVNGNLITQEWRDSSVDGRLMRHDAELYYYSTWQGDGQCYHVRNVANNCLNHVAVNNLSGVICNLVIEAPTLGTNEEYNYTVQFDCTSSSGSCTCSVENAAPKIFYKSQLDHTNQWLRVTGAANPSDAIDHEIQVVDMVNPNYTNIIDGNGQTQNVVYSVGHSEKYLRIESASYYGGGSGTTYAGPNVITSVNLRNDVATSDTTVDFSGSPTYQIRVHGNVWELVRF